ncbi:hypothetical protein TeGR_g6214 [Tetraparma gracilis]|uniref:peptide-methionine (S)-S-oxide reductase n=1 Tax=Tetraparma gracilis TaxID=2962635 RepID=A0ABQ6N863_9STRA|nr:hypothetical protein TeGR_g6214 [Tetraparma gracilis]
MISALAARSALLLLLLFLPRSTSFLPPPAALHPAALHPLPPLATSSSLAASAYFGCGCFWSPQSAFAEIPGVAAAQAGYANGEGVPTYQRVCQQSTSTNGWVEAVRVDYDPARVSFRELLGKHDEVRAPAGKRQYKNVVFATSPGQEEEARAAGLEVEPLKDFWKAEGYHQDYWKKWRVRGAVLVLLLVGAGVGEGEVSRVCQGLYAGGVLGALAERVLDRKVVRVEEASCSMSAEVVEVGTPAYYKGFLQSSLDGDANSRGDGVEQALKLGLASASLLAVLVLGFLASNNLLG